MGGNARNNRNLAIYDRLIINTSADDYVFALDAATGETVWETQILDYHINPAMQSSGPIIANGKVISGRSRGWHGVITAHDARTGEDCGADARFRLEPGEPGAACLLRSASRPSSVHSRHSAGSRRQGVGQSVCRRGGLAGPEGRPFGGHCGYDDTPVHRLAGCGGGRGGPPPLGADTDRGSRDRGRQTRIVGHLARSSKTCPPGRESEGPWNAL